MPAPYLVIGAGPGGKDHVTPAARDAAGQCRLLAGNPLSLELLAQEAQDTRILGGDLNQARALIADPDTPRPLGFAVSGDPGFYSLLGYLRRYLEPQQLQVIPGISSLQALFSRLAEPWWGYRSVSLHGRPWTQLEKATPGEPLALLTDPGTTPGAVAAQLLQRGWRPEHPAVVGTRLTLPGENIWQGPLERAETEAPRGEAAVMVVKTVGS